MVMNQVQGQIATQSSLPDLRAKALDLAIRLRLHNEENLGGLGNMVYVEDIVSDSEVVMDYLLAPMTDREKSVMSHT